MEEGLAALACDPSNRSALELVMRHFHSLAGSGTTYGMPRVTEIARDVDLDVREVLESGAEPDPDRIERWGQGLGRVRGEFSLAGREKPLVRLRHDHHTGGPGGKTVFIVEDDLAVMDSLRAALQEEGFATRMAASKKDAMALLRGGLPDALLADVILPDGSGLDVVEFVRSWPGGDRVAAIAMSVRSEFLDKVAALHAGADAFFEKPLDLDALKRRLKQFLRETPAAEEPRVLSVEDDPQQAAFIRAVLEAGGFEVATCDDPLSFEADMLSFQPDLVLMDANIPGLDGYDLTRYLRMEERYATLPVVFLTAEGDERAKIEVVQAGGDDHLVKPVTPTLLLNTVAIRIQRSRFLKGLLYRDGLTRLFTHTAFQERARIAHALRTRREDGRVAAALLDLDGFKEVNDRYGHLAGDRVLAAFSTMLRRRFRKADTLGRMGGDEFAVIIEDLDGGDALHLLGLFVKTFSETEQISPDGERFRVTCSGGIAMLDPASMSVDDWLGAADEALYRAKAAGGGRVLASGPAPARDDSP
jgi:diguanylate cyclase (GGDEF)-like protein